MNEIVSGRRLGPFILLTDGEGLRHAVRANAIVALSDADDQLGTTTIQLPGGRALLILVPFEDVLAWVS
ncbi:hypothetical protein E2C06_23210 [Dankookia rubra]|uniref:Uncharacterized protein n=1 Tax=Dankookia rubra TaxID=1442381 RepID=A0A4R5QAZ6_9PROT|nr:hypothetical protein [Dankookia rubra]TDH60240.1 hypothetical protein E2C06_23210 [Dankookia rubra]